MNIENVPFNQHIEIRRSSKVDYLLEIASSGYHCNHVGTIHAAVLLALAEASAGEFLLQLISTEDLTAVVCRSTAKYSKPANGIIRSKVGTSETDAREALKALNVKRRVLLDIETSVFTESGTLVASFTFTWLLAK